jgi:hypothetical protein
MGRVRVTGGEFQVDQKDDVHRRSPLPPAAGQCHPSLPSLHHGGTDIGNTRSPWHIVGVICVLRELLRVAVRGRGYDGAR